MIVSRPIMRAALVLAPLALADAAAAQGAASRYVTFDVEKCAIIEEDKETASVTRHCRGFGDTEFFVGEGDLRIFVGFGANGLKQKAFSQTLSPFNSIHHTLEFRFKPGAAAPHAVILRYFTSGIEGKATGQVLVVTKLDGREACHMAYIDALANPAPNDIAQKTADEGAAGFDCAHDEPKIVGASGKSPV